VVEETARTFRIDMNGDIKTVPKSTGKFTISSSRFELKVRGNSILMRPEERLKNLRRIIRDEKKGDYYN
jgi:RNase P/RNase MRP subunit p29